MIINLTVTNLATLEQRTYCCPPLQAVIAAHAQDRGDFNTWQYEQRYASTATYGKQTVCCGDWCCPLMFEDELPAMDDAVYKRWFALSFLWDGVRVGPSVD